MSPVRIVLVCCAMLVSQITLHAAEAQSIANGDGSSMDARSIDMVSPIPHEVFRNKLADFLGRVFWEQGETLSQVQRLEIVDQAIQDCAWLEVCREGDVVRMAVLRLVAPDLVADDAYREAVIEQVPNPKQRTAMYLGEMAFHTNAKDKELFYGKVNFWWEFVKGNI